MGRNIPCSTGDFIQPRVNDALAGHTHTPKSYNIEYYIILYRYTVIMNTVLSLFSYSKWGFMDMVCLLRNLVKYFGPQPDSVHCMCGPCAFPYRLVYINTMACQHPMRYLSYYNLFCCTISPLGMAISRSSLKKHTP